MKADTAAHGPEPKLIDAADTFGREFPAATVLMHRDRNPTTVTVRLDDPPADFRERVGRIAREKDVPHKFTGEGEAEVVA